MARDMARQLAADPGISKEKGQEIENRFRELTTRLEAAKQRILEEPAGTRRESA